MSLLLRTGSKQHQKCVLSSFSTLHSIYFRSIRYTHITHNHVPFSSRQLPLNSQKFRTLHSHHHSSPFSSSSQLSQNTNQEVQTHTSTTTSTTNNNNKKSKRKFKSKSDEDDITNSIRLMMHDAKKSGNQDVNIIQAYCRAVAHGVGFNLHDNLNILNHYCSNIKTPLYNYDNVKTLYASIIDQKGMNYQVFCNMLAVSRHENNQMLILGVNKDYESFYKHTVPSLTLLLSTFTEMNDVHHALKYYKLYRSYMADNSAYNAKNINMNDIGNNSDSMSDIHVNASSVSSKTLLPFIPLQSNFKPLDVKVHLSLIRMLCLRDDHRLLALETLLDFAEDNDKSEKYQMGRPVMTSEEVGAGAGAAGGGGGGASCEGHDNINDHDRDNNDCDHDNSNTLPRPSYITSQLIARHMHQNLAVGISLLELLDESLVRYDAGMVKVLLEWLAEACDYLQQHQQIQNEKKQSMSPKERQWSVFHAQSNVTDRVMFIQKGLLQRCFQLAGALGNAEIANLTKELCDLTGLDLKENEYSQLFVAYCRARDVESVIETLVVAEASGIDFFSNHSTPSSNSSGGRSSSSRSSTGGNSLSRQIIRKSEVNLLAPRYIQMSISKMLGSLEESDRLYYSLAELVNVGMNPPISALNSLIISQGNLFFLDRAFAVMQEFEAVFNTKPNAHTYYALLGAVAKSRMPKVEYILQILSDMDDSGSTPDGGCFSFLLETMMKCNDTEGATSILEHLRTSSTTTTTTTTASTSSPTIATATEASSINASVVADSSGSSSSGGSSSESGSVNQQAGTEKETERHTHTVETVDVSMWPSLRTLRQLAIYYTKRGHTEQCEVVKQMIREKSGNNVLPTFFTQRLDVIVQRKEKANAHMRGDDSEPC